MEARASSSSWGGSPTSFFNSKYLFFGFHLKMVNLEICCGKLQMKGSLDEMKRSYVASG